MTGSREAALRTAAAAMRVVPPEQQLRQSVDRPLSARASSRSLSRAASVGDAMPSSAIRSARTSSRTAPGEELQQQQRRAPSASIRSESCGSNRSSRASPLGGNAVPAGVPSGWSSPHAKRTDILWPAGTPGTPPSARLPQPPTVSVETPAAVGSPSARLSIAGTPTARSGTHRAHSSEKVVRRAQQQQMQRLAEPFSARQRSAGTPTRWQPQNSIRTQIVIQPSGKVMNQTINSPTVPAWMKEQGIAQRKEIAEAVFEKETTGGKRCFARNEVTGRILNNTIVSRSAPDFMKSPFEANCRYFEDQGVAEMRRDPEPNADLPAGKVVDELVQKDHNQLGMATIVSTSAPSFMRQSFEQHRPYFEERGSLQRVHYAEALQAAKEHRKGKRILCPNFTSGEIECQKTHVSAAAPPWLHQYQERAAGGRTVGSSGESTLRSNFSSRKFSASPAWR